MLKTLDVLHVWKESEFQSLIGMLKTEYDCSGTQRRELVSIPHRYAENCGGVYELCFLDGEFQSLIGMLKTHHYHSYRIHPGQFQSLIGMLKTLFL